MTKFGIDTNASDRSILEIGIRYAGQVTDKIWTYVFLKVNGRWFSTGTGPQDASTAAVLRWLERDGREVVFANLITGRMQIWPEDGQGGRPGHGL